MKIKFKLLIVALICVCLSCCPSRPKEVYTRQDAFEELRFRYSIWKLTPEHQRKPFRVMDRN